MKERRSESRRGKLAGPVSGFGVALTVSPLLCGVFSCVLACLSSPRGGVWTQGAERTRLATRRGVEREELHFPMSRHSSRDFPGGAAAKKLPAWTGDAGDVGLSLGSPSREDALGKERQALQCPCWETPWIEEPLGLQSLRSERVEQDLETKTITPLTQPLGKLGVGLGGSAPRVYAQRSGSRTLVCWRP